MTSRTVTAVFPAPKERVFDYLVWTGVMPIRAITNLIAAAERTVPL